jgi:hypothetical protein
VKISEKTVAEVVAEASAKMSDPNYSAVMVGGFVQTQDAAAKYVSAYEGELGGAEGVVNTIFHASLLALCFQRANNRTVRALTFEDLDHVSSGDRKKALSEQQPALLEYIEQNVEQDEMKSLLMLLALGFEWAS